MVPPLMVMKMIISTSCGPASPGIKYLIHETETLNRQISPRCSNNLTTFKVSSSSSLSLPQNSCLAAK